VLSTSTLDPSDHIAAIATFWEEERRKRSNDDWIKTKNVTQAHETRITANNNGKSRKGLRNE